MESPHPNHLLGVAAMCRSFLRYGAILRHLLGSALFAATFALGLAAPTPSHATDWSGPYAGIALGGRNLEADWTTTQTFAPIGVPIPFSPFSAPTASFDSTDFYIGGFGGWNWHMPSSNWVVGIEGRFGYANNDDRVNRIPGLGNPPFATPPVSFTEVEAEWDGSIRVRGGFLVTPTVLLYGTGGIAFMEVEETTTCPADTFVCNPAFGTRVFSDSDTMTGWTIGGGIEAMFGGNWIGRIDYSYADYGSFSFVAIPAIPGRTFGANAKLDVETHTITAGIGMKF